MAAKPAVFTIRNARTGEVLVDVDLQAAKTPHDEDGTQNKETVAASSQTEAMNDTLALIAAAQRESYAFFGRVMAGANNQAAAADDGSNLGDNDDAESSHVQSSEWSVDNTRADSIRGRPKRSRAE